MKTNEAIKALRENIAVLQNNIDTLSKFDYSPFEDSDITEIVERLSYVSGLCQTYIDFANGRQPEKP
ncbi:MAG: hypothetical protein II454_00405 [Bacteroidales bacterium]|nr:hypothetical protein [Bacteroidales bacterium]